MADRGPAVVVRAREPRVEAQRNPAHLTGEPREGHACALSVARLFGSKTPRSAAAAWDARLPGGWRSCLGRLVKMADDRAHAAPAPHADCRARGPLETGRSDRWPHELPMSESADRSPTTDMVDHESWASSVMARNAR
jgi:hypothetical protein